MSFTGSPSKNTSSVIRDVSASSSFLHHRKTLKTCDPCRRRKVRCNGNEKPGSRCTNCIVMNIEVCTYKMPTNAQRRGSKAYVEDLEIRAENAERLLRLLSPGIDLTKALNQTDSHRLYFTRKKPTASTSVDVDAEDLESSEDEYHSHLVNHDNPFFWGKSSGFRLLRLAMKIRELATGKPPKCIRANSSMREEFWTIPEFTRPPMETLRATCNFPDPELLSALVDLYFVEVNAFVPLLHRPTFESSIASQLHLRDVQFGRIALLVCGIGARYSDDPRITSWSYDEPSSPGWIMFHQAQKMGRSVLSKPSLYDIQGYCLSAIFLEGAAPDHTRWVIIGTGIRLAQEAGAYSKRKLSSKPTLQEELWKRAFWVLMVLDRVCSRALGRTCALQEEDFDLELPIECDDDHWIAEDSDDPFQQPEGEPSDISYFIWSLQLSDILALVVRKSCAVKKFKVGTNKEWDRRTLKRLDSALETWKESLPAHLQWGGKSQSPLHYKQSAILHTQYYTLQIAAHKPFIQLRNGSSVPTPSLTVCNSAARACCELVNAASGRLGKSWRMCTMAIFSCSVHLLLNMWHSKQDPRDSEDLRLVLTSMEILSSIEQRWHSAGRLRDVLAGLVTSTEQPKPGVPMEPFKFAASKSIPRGDKAGGYSLSKPAFTMQPLPGFASQMPPSIRNELKIAAPLIFDKQPYQPPPLSAAFWTDLDYSSFLPTEPMYDEVAESGWVSMT